MKAVKFSIVILCAAFLASCSRGAETSEHSETIFAMDTVMELKAFGENGDKAIKDAREEITRLDQTLSRKTEGGDVCTVNKNGSARVGEDTAEIVQASSDVSASTNGCFDITIAPVMDLWGFFTKDYYVPSDSELQTVLEKVDYKNITLDGENLTLNNGAQIDLGGIAKGYASKKVMEIFKENGVKSGIVSLGGNVHCLGTRPDRSPWRVAVQTPDGDGYIGILSVSDTAVITSGGYQRFFERDGRIFHHIIDPKTGMSADSGLKSATIVSKDSTRADALSTAVFVMGLDRAIDFWRAQGGFDMLLLTDDNKVFLTSGISGSFESDFEYAVIE